MDPQLEQVTTEAYEAVTAAGDLAELRAVSSRLLGRNGPLAAVRRTLGSLPAEERRRIGRDLTEAARRIEAAVQARRAELEAATSAARAAAERMDLTEIRAPRLRGRRHVVTRTTERLLEVFVGMGYRVAEGPEVETDWYNFEALNFPPGHPARDMQDTLFVDLGPPESTLLRTHTSPVQIRVMETTPPPIYVVIPGRVYRRDTADATHTPVFHQLECLAIDRDLTFADLAGTIEEFTHAFFGPGWNTRLRPSYFPFTEPSAEFDLQRPDGSWLELGGCGMVHPNVLRAGGLDPEEWQGFAFGFGLDRMAASFHGIEDLRELFIGDVRLLEAV